MPLSLLPSSRCPGLSAAAGLVVLAGLSAVAGCSKNAATAPVSPTPVGGDLVTGPSLVASSGCTNCHVINGQGGHRGPDLSHVGADPRHTPQWLAAYIKNPRQVDPGSRMPPFGGRIQEKDLTTLGVYLATLK